MKKIITLLLTMAMTALLLPAASVCATDLTVSKSGKAVIPQDTKKVSAGAFKSNTDVTSAVIPDGCAVENEAFANCVNLKSVTFEGSSAYIGSDAFLNCTSLEKLTFKKPNASIKYIGENALDRKSVV